MANHFSEFAPVDFLDHTVRAFAELLPEVFPVDAGNQKVERIYQGVDTRTNYAPHQVPVNVIYKAVEGLCKGCNKRRYLRSDIVPVEDFVQLLQAVIDAGCEVRSQSLPVLGLDEVFYLIRDALDAAVDFCGFKTAAGTCTAASSASAACIVIFFDVQLIERGQLLLCFLCRRARATYCSTQSFCLLRGLDEYALTTEGRQQLSYSICGRNGQRNDIIQGRSQRLDNRACCRCRRVAQLRHGRGNAIKRRSRRAVELGHVVDAFNEAAP